MNSPPEIARRRTFAIVSHPDAGKTTVTEKLLLLGGAINSAGTVKARKSQKHATSDWMEIEQQRGISVTSSVMQFEYGDCIVNLLDTPGHEDFSEDTYRTLTAVDSALMVVDAAKGVEDRTIKLLEVCRMRKTPVITLVNKLDRNALEPLDIIDDIERTLNIQCAPMTWPLGSGQNFRGVYALQSKQLIPFFRDNPEDERVWSLGSDEAAEHFDDTLLQLDEEIELLEGAGNEFDPAAYLAGEQTPVFFGSALRGFGIRELLDCFVTLSPDPQPRQTELGPIGPETEKFSGFVFKIQANMDPQHRDRIAFLRICSGKFNQGMKIQQIRTQKAIAVPNALTFMARGREHVEESWAGDIIGIHNHGTIQIGDTFSNGKAFTFQGIPSFAPELFRRVRTRDPLRAKALAKGLNELSEEGAAQVFKLESRNELIVGAVGLLQYDVVQWRLQHEYNVECVFEPVQYQTARWFSCDKQDVLEKFKRQLADNLAVDAGGYLAYLAPTMVNLQLTQERWEDIVFFKTREIHAGETLAMSD